jgi:hypothetical protein
MSLDDSKINEVQKHFQALSAVASSLNAASDALTKVVSTLDESLKKLNVGVTAWVTFRSRADANSDPETYDDDQIGYCKIRGTWGISLRHIWGNAGWDDHNSDGPWLFNDAPRDLRLRSVDKIPDLIEALGKEASETIKQVHESTQRASALAGAIEQIVLAEKTGVKLPPPPPSPKWAPLDPTPAESATTVLKRTITPFERAPQGLPTIGELARGKKGGK